MTAAAAKAAIDRMESDEAFADRIKEAGSADGALAILHGEGFDVTQQEMRDVALDRFGDRLTPEQLDAVSGGVDDPWRVVGMIGAGGVLGVVIVVAAASL